MVRVPPARVTRSLSAARPRSGRDGPSAPSLEMASVAASRTMLARVASDGYSVADIARILHLAPGTVRNYLSSAIGKTHTTTRHDAARHAREQGWI